MQQLGNLFSPATPRPSRWERNRFRNGAQFIDPAAVATPLDRNQRAKLIYLAEALERRTKPRGRRNGVLGYIGLAVLKALLLRFANAKTGACYPSITQLCAVTGLCRAAVCDALARLERCGIIRITRRIVRTAIERVSPVTGALQKFVGVVQTSNAYSFSVDAHSDMAAEAVEMLPPANGRPFPARRQRSLLDNLLNSLAESSWKGGTDKSVSERRRKSPD
ncbi:MAG: helix-turn-helix domain-containing protein [Hyphomicrobiaceae bacterium]|nr:helix-turn-helix domain-containing protein [Hyphomicrobiaceae bacterium]